jgi:chromosome segregation ATPase
MAASIQELKEESEQWSVQIADKDDKIRALAEEITSSNSCIEQLEEANAKANEALQDNPAVKLLEERVRSLQTQRLEDFKLFEQRKAELEEGQFGGDFDEPEQTPAKKVNRRMSFAGGMTGARGPGTVQRGVTGIPGTSRKVPGTTRAAKREPSDVQALELQKQITAQHELRAKKLDRDLGEAKKAIEELESFRKAFTDKEIELAKLSAMHNANKDAAKQSSLEVKRLQGSNEGLRKSCTDSEKEAEKLKGDIKAAKDKVSLSALCSLAPFLLSTPLLFCLSQPCTHPDFLPYTGPFAYHLDSNLRRN